MTKSRGLHLPRMSFRARLAEFRARLGDDVCWVWPGSTDHFGYGQTTFEGRHRLVHAVAFEIEKGALPKGLCVCHDCDNPPCFNPAHLWPGTKGDNTQDAMNKRRMKPGGQPLGARNFRTHCPQGHEYTPENSSYDRGYRHCRRCHREREAARRARA